MNAATAEHGDNLSGRPKGETENWGQDGSRRDEFTEANIYEIAIGIRCLPELFNALTPRTEFQSLIYSSTIPSS